ncbi:MAG: F0F1 ATP synthase subunit A [Alphaproteobacteria bacterium]|nr:F0F1 ATP synthase subunit A [Alphaproteobacteria bacterium]
MSGSQSLQPLQQFLVKTLIPINVFGFDLSLTNSAAFMLGATGLIVLGLGLGLRRTTGLPNRVQTLAELPFSFVEGMVLENNGKEGLPFVGFLTSIFLFVLMGNLLGLLPFAFTFTSQIIVNFSLAFLILCVVTVYGFIRNGAGFLRLFLPEGVPLWIAPILVPVELVSYLSRPVSLSIRLFANMVAGHSILKIFAFFTASLGVFGIVPLAVNVGLIGFEFFVAFIQAYIFTLLSCMHLNDTLHSH